MVPGGGNPWAPPPLYEILNVEDELVVLVYCNKDDANQQIMTCTRFLTIEAPKKLMLVV